MGMKRVSGLSSDTGHESKYEIQWECGTSVSCNGFVTDMVPKTIVGGQFFRIASGAKLGNFVGECLTRDNRFDNRRSLDNSLIENRESDGDEVVAEEKEKETIKIALENIAKVLEADKELGGEDAEKVSKGEIESKEETESVEQKEEDEDSELAAALLLSASLSAETDAPEEAEADADAEADAEKASISQAHEDIAVELDANEAERVAFEPNLNGE